MSKKLLLLFFLMFTFPFSAQAHTTLLSSTPTEGQSVTEVLTEVELVFGTEIEEGSTMSIEGEAGSYEFDDIAIKNNVMTGNFSETLPNGSYRILWNIIGEDGHPIEGNIAFSMLNEVKEKEKAETVPAVDEKMVISEKKSVELQKEKNSNLPVTILLVLAAVLIVYGIYKLMLKKK